MHHSCENTLLYVVVFFSAIDTDWYDRNSQWVIYTAVYSLTSNVISSAWKQCASLLLLAKLLSCWQSTVAVHLLILRNFSTDVKITRGNIIHIIFDKLYFAWRETKRFVRKTLPFGNKYISFRLSLCGL